MHHWMYFKKELNPKPISMTMSFDNLNLIFYEILKIKESMKYLGQNK